jgi:hypothetical protein
MATNSTLSSTFNQQFSTLFKLIQTNLPNNTEITKAVKYMDDLRRVNPRIAIVMWKQFVVIPYGERICAGDIDFFLTKDYTSDLSTIPGITDRDKQKIMDVINNGIRAPMRELFATNTDTIRTSMITLTRLADSYSP